MQKQPQKHGYPAIVLLVGLVSVVFFLGWDFVYNSPDILPKPARAQEAGVVAIDPAWLPCTKDTDCALIDTKCSNCCGYHAINVNSIDEFSDAKEKLCRGWQGGVCDCYNPIEPSCQKGKCVNLRVIADTFEDPDLKEEKKTDELPRTTPPRPEPVEP